MKTPCAINDGNNNPTTADVFLDDGRLFDKAVLLFDTEVDVSEYLESDAPLPPLLYYPVPRDLIDMLRRLQQDRESIYLAMNPRHENDKVIVSGVFLIDDFIAKVR